MLLGNLATNLASMNSPADALAAAHESLQLRRVLATENSERFRPELAWTLNDAGISFGRFQRWEEARGATAEAVMLCRALTGANSAACSPHLA